jgi:hypothetical protein
MKSKSLKAEVFGVLLSLFSSEVRFGVGACLLFETASCGGSAKDNAESAAFLALLLT